MDHKLNRILYYFLVGIMLFALISAPIVMVVYNSSYPDEFNYSEIPYVLLGVLYGVGVYTCYKRYFRPQYVSWLVPVSFIIMNAVAITYVCLSPTVPVSDYEVIWACARSIADGTFDINEHVYYEYISMFSYQMGIAWFESLFIRMFGPVFLPLQIFNIILLNATAVLMWALCRRYLSRGGCTLALFLFATYYPVLSTTPQFTNQHISCVIILGIILLMTSGKIYKWVIAGLLVATLNTLRPMGVILLMTAAVYALAIIITRRESAKRPLVSLVSLVAVYSVSMGLINHGFERARYAVGDMTSSKVPWFKLDKGLTGYEWPAAADFGSLEEFNKWEKAKVIEAVTDDLGTTATFVTGKMTRYLGGYDYKVEMTYNHDKEIWSRPGIKRMIDLGWGQYLTIVFFAALSLAKRRKDTDFIQPAYIFYIGITLVYIFIEAFSSYRYESYPYLIMMSCLIYSGRNSLRSIAKA